MSTPILLPGGEFADPADEGAYRARRLPEHRRQLHAIFLAATVINVLFLASDARFFGQPRFPMVVAARAVIILASLACMGRTAHQASFRSLQNLCLLWGVPALAASAVLVRPATDLALFVTAMLPVVFYLAFPISYRATLALGLGCSAATLAAILAGRPWSGAHLGMVLTMATINTVLALVVARINRLQRLEWHATRAAEAANAALVLDLAQREELEADLRRLASTDSLTGLANRARFFAQAATEVSRAQRHGHPLAVVMLDLDHFKRVNDTCGHEAGDAALRTFADLCRSLVRDQDLAARIGGEEFALLLPETDAPGALTLAGRLGEAVAAQPVPGLATPLTVSGGVSQWQPGEATVEAALVRADRALYAAKQAGRNQARLYDPATLAPACG